MMAALTNKENGFSLTELLVTLTVSMLLASGVLHFTISNSRAFRAQQDIIHIQERARFASRLMEYNIRLTEHWGAASWADRTGDLPDITERSGCNDAWVFDGDTPLEGYEGGNTLSSLGTPAGCIDEDDYVLTSDILVTRFAGDQPVKIADIDDDTVYWKVTVGDGSEIVLGSDVAGVDDPNILYYPYNVSMFTVRPCYLTENNEDCGADDDNGNPIPTLVRYYLNGKKVEVERILEGVENMQFEYGVHIESADGTNGVCWLEADEMNDVLSKCNSVGAEHSSWADVAFVRFSMLIRSRDKDGSFKDFTIYRMLREGQLFTPTGDSQHYRRKLIERTVKLRNRSIDT